VSDKYKATNIDKAYFVTTTIVGWIDLFTRKSMKDVITNSLKYCQENKGLVIYAWCLMPSHLHLICSSSSELTISEIMRDFKKFTARDLLNKIKNTPESRREWLLAFFANECKHLKRNQKFKVWQNGYHAEELFSNKFIYQKVEYVHNNPVVDGVVELSEDYLYCSAPIYAGKEGIIDVVCIPQRLRTMF
jgi:REP element-mobilizing transposase RayT